MHVYCFSPQSLTLTDGWPEGLGELGLELDLDWSFDCMLLFCSLVSAELMSVAGDSNDSFSCNGKD